MTASDDLERQVEGILQRVIVHYRAESPQEAVSSMSKEEAKAAILQLLTDARRDGAIEELEELSLAVVEPCEPDCDEVRHALHEGSWGAHLVIENRLAALRQMGNGKEV